MESEEKIKLKNNTYRQNTHLNHINKDSNCMSKMAWRDQGSDRSQGRSKKLKFVDRSKDVMHLHLCVENNDEIETCLS